MPPAPPGKQRLGEVGDGHPAGEAPAAVVRGEANVLDIERPAAVVQSATDIYWCTALLGQLALATSTQKVVDVSVSVGCRGGVEVPGALELRCAAGAEAVGFGEVAGE
jgi:hypothetical protein